MDFKVIPMESTPEIEKAIALLYKGLGAFLRRNDPDAVWDLRLIKDRVDDMIEETIRAVEQNATQQDEIATRERLYPASIETANEVPENTPKKAARNMGAYVLATWIPDHFTRCHIPKSEEARTEINAPNDAIAVKRARKSLPETGMRVGTLTTPKGRIVMNCYGVCTMSKVAWDDPPEYAEISYRSFLAKNEEEAKTQVPAGDWNAGGGWEKVILYGPDVLTLGGLVHAAHGIPNGAGLENKGLRP